MGFYYHASRSSVSVNRIIYQRCSNTMNYLFSVLKDRKKTDKTIIDSQERAFWRVMRPSVSFKINRSLKKNLFFYSIA
jgi:hypothetical protein